MNIRVDLNTSIKDGTEVVFRSPVDCSQVTGLKVYYPGASQEFVFADAHGNNVGDIDHLFAENVAVKVILDVTTSMAFVQNADTNAYLEGRFTDLEAKIGTGGGKQYELIEDITLEEAVASLTRTHDPQGNAYNFSAIRMFIRTAKSTGTAQLIFNIGSETSNYYVYYQKNDVLVSGKEQDAIYRQYNDNGRMHFEGAAGAKNNVGYFETRPTYWDRGWKNVTRIELTVNSDSVLIPAGTTIKIYGIRG